MQPQPQQPETETVTVPELGPARQPVLFQREQMLGLKRLLNFHSLASFRIVWCKLDAMEQDFYVRLLQRRNDSTSARAAA